MRKMFRVIIHELLAILPAALFFLILFHLLAFTRSITLTEYNIDVSFSALATISALIIAKVIIVADNLPLINMFQHKPLIFDVCWRTLIYGIVALIIQYLELFIPHLIHTRSTPTAIRLVMDEVTQRQFWANHLWLLFGLLVYCTMSALVRALGAQRARALFFRVSPQPPESFHC